MDTTKARKLKIKSNQTGIIAEKIKVKKYVLKYRFALPLNGKVDILTIAESKLDNSFPDGLLSLSGYKSPYRLDVSDKSGGLLVYINNNIPSRQLNLFATAEDIQLICIEINLRKQKWLLISIYRPPKQSLSYFIKNLTSLVDFYSKDYKNILINGDFNASPENPDIQRFLDANDFYNHHSFKTCWKSDNGSCIDLILSNQKHSLQHTGVCEPGISDHHSLIYTMLRTHFVKLPPKTFLYRSYKSFDQDRFLSDLESSLSEFNVQNYKQYEDIFSHTLDKHAPLKTKVLRGNNSPHMNKELRKAIMKRSRLKNQALKTKLPGDWANYKIQRNLVVSLNRKSKKTLFNSLNPVSQNQGFWKTCKPYFSDKNVVEERILLVEGNKIVSDDKELSSVFNTYFNTITNTLSIPKWNAEFNCHSIDPIAIAIEKHSSHPSILKIKEKFHTDTCFSFTEISSDQTLSEILKLKSGKKTSGKIPVKELQLAAREIPSVSVLLTECFNNSIKSGSFPDELALADIVPIHKKGSTTEKSNYRPFSLLPTVSKVFERLLFKQISDFMECKLSKFLCGFRKSYSTQHALLNLIKEWQQTLDISGKIGAVLMDLSKAYDCLPHDLLIAKLAAYGFDSESLRFLYSYLSNRKQRVRVGSSLSEWLSVLLGVPQGSVLGPLLFNIFLNDLLFFISRSSICNFADDNTISVSNNSIEVILDHLNTDVKSTLEWFRVNSMVANPEKFQLIFLGVKDDDQLSMSIDGKVIESSKDVKLLGITIDKKT